MAVRKRTWTTETGEIKSAWVADFKDQFRKRHQLNFGTKKEADAALLKARNEINRGVFVDKRAVLTVGEVYEDMLAKDVERRLRVGNMKMGGGRKTNIELAWKNHLKTAFGKTPVDRFADLTLIQDWLDGDRDRIGKLEEISKRTGRPLEIRTIENLIQLLSQILSWAVRKRLGLVHNPLNDAWPEIPERPTREIAFLEADQVALLLKWIMSPREAGKEAINVWRTRRIATMLSLFGGLRC